MNVIKVRWRLRVEYRGNTAARHMMLTLVTVVARHCSAKHWSIVGLVSMIVDER